MEMPISLGLLVKLLLPQESTDHLALVGQLVGPKRPAQAVLAIEQRPGIRAVDDLLIGQVGGLDVALVQMVLELGHPVRLGRVAGQPVLSRLLHWLQLPQGPSGVPGDAEVVAGLIGAPQGLALSPPGLGQLGSGETVLDLDPFPGRLAEAPRECGTQGALGGDLLQVRLGVGHT